MKKRLFSLLAVALLLFGLSTPAFASTRGDSRYTLFDVTTNTQVCTSVTGGMACNNTLVAGHFYTLKGSDATGQDVQNAAITVAHSNTKWSGYGAFVDYHGTTAPTCTFTDTSTALHYTCSAASDTIIDVIFYGYASSVTDDTGKVNVKYSGALGTNAAFTYNTP
jgi:hypothetical protein